MQTPRVKLAALHGIGNDVLDPVCRRVELTRWLDLQVLRLKA
jgi:hypothetical protein